MTEPNIDMCLDTTETKIAYLSEFFTHPSSTDGFVNSNKFLFLYGNENTGVLPILKLAVQQVFGDAWESSVYLREDKGQKFPYKLHAHKVESSRKVIFVSKNTEHWEKWKSLYPHSKTYQFTEMYISPEQQIANNLPREVRHFDFDSLKVKLRETIDEYSSRHHLSNFQSVELKGKVLAVLNEMLYI